MIAVRPTTAGGIGVGNHVLFTYAGALNGSFANFAIANETNYRQGFTVDTLSTPGQVVLNVSGTAGNLTWSGGTAGNVWNINGASNWNAGTERFYETDATTFDDTGSNAAPVNIATVVMPIGVTVNNATKDYVFAGTGRITGPTGLNKSGAAKLTLTNPTHDFSGPVNITGGLVSGSVLSNNGVAGSFGTGPITLDGGGLEFTGGSITSNRTITLGISGGTIAVAERLGVLTLSTAIAGTGDLIKSGPGILSLTPVETFAGNITVNAGILRVTANNTLSAKTVTVNDGATFDPNGQPGTSTTGRPILSITGNGAPGFAAIFNTGAGQTNSPLYSVINLTGDASIGSFNRYDLNGGAGAPTGLTFNGGSFTLTKVGSGRIVVVAKWRGNGRDDHPRGGPFRRPKLEQPWRYEFTFPHQFWCGDRGLWRPVQRQANLFEWRRHHQQSRRQQHPDLDGRRLREREQLAEQYFPRQLRQRRAARF